MSEAVETGIEIPARGKGTGRPSKYGFGDMGVGQSKFFEGHSTSGGAYSAAQSYALNTGKRFTGRNVEGGVRIWRVS